RMHTDRAPDIGMRFGNRAHRRKLVEPRANRHHRADPGGTGALDDSLALWREVGEIEMAMAVDQQLRRSPLPPRHSAGRSRAAPEAPGPRARHRKDRRSGAPPLAPRADRAAPMP